jgi:hypothetical protein
MVIATRVPVRVRPNGPRAVTGADSSSAPGASNAEIIEGGLATPRSPPRCDTVAPRPPPPAAQLPAAMSWITANLGRRWMQR